MSSHLIFLSLLYFVQGIPYGLQSRFLPTYFRSHGMSLTNVGFFKLLLAPWMLKAIWAPLVDKHGTKKIWLVWSMVGLVGTCIAAAFLDAGHLMHLAMVLLMFNLLTSTQDIAVDGIAISMLSASELGYGNIAQVVGYKFGAILGGGLLTSLMDYISWSSLFRCLAVVYGLAVVIICIVLPNERKRTPKNIDTSKEKQSSNKSEIKSWIRTHLSDVINTEGTWWILLFVLLYKLGEQGALSMTPLFLVDHGVNTSVIGFWLGINGQIISILGSVLGGCALSYLKLPVLKSLKITISLRMFLVGCLCSVVVFWKSTENILGFDVNLALTIIWMSMLLLLSGTITTLTFTLMMQCSQKAPEKVQASHYTTLATFEVLGKLTFSALTGALTDAVGYEFSYVLFFLLTVSVVIFISSNSAHRIINRYQT